MPPRKPHFRPPIWSDERPDLVLPVRIDRRGETGPTERQAASSKWRQTSRGFYVPAWVDGASAAQRILEASVVVPKWGAITGWAALHAFGAKWCDGTRADGSLVPVPIVAPEHGIRPQPGIFVSGERLPPCDMEWVDDFQFTTRRRSVLFEARRAADVREAVGWLDLAAAADLVELESLRSFLASGMLQGWTGIGQARQAAALAVENCWSPAEKDMRLAWVLDLGLPSPLCNHPVFDLRGNHVGTPDLLDVEAGLVGEYDGEVHWGKRGRDLQREGAFRRLGLEYVAMVNADRHNPDDFLRRTMDARARGVARAGQARAWTVVPPRWWTPTTTVLQRIRLTPLQRERYLRWQAA